VIGVPPGLFARLFARLWERLIDWRNARVADPAVQRWSAAFPLTRPMARAHALRLHDLCAGFVHSRILAACLDLRLFEAMAPGPATAPALAARIGLMAERAQRLLRGAAALDFVTEARGGRWRLGALGAAAMGAPGAREMVAHHALFYADLADLADPAALLRGDGPPTRLSRFWA